MSDLISRQRAIETSLEFFVEFLGGAFYKNSQKELIARFQRLPSAQPEHRWIPCSERLPEEKERSYWVCLETGGQFQCRWTNDMYGLGSNEWSEWGWHIMDKPQYSKIVAWMPLPEPYREEGE